MLSVALFFPESSFWLQLLSLRLRAADLTKTETNEITSLFQSPTQRPYVTVHQKLRDLGFWS